MHPADSGDAFEIGQGAGDAQHPVITTCGKVHSVRGFAQQCLAGSVGVRHFLQQLAIGFGITANGFAMWRQLAVTQSFNIAYTDDTRPTSALP